MGPVEAVQTCFRKYVDFSGRATRPEYWWFFLFDIVVSVVLALVDPTGILYLIVVLGLFLPGLTVSFRRLHDTGHSGWWILISLIPLIGAIWLLVLLVRQGDAGPNKYGPPPSAIPAVA
jgi:uncharacterized membrane protein YhaH (DUF805 family)